jgi:hypothetical protein
MIIIDGQVMLTSAEAAAALGIAEITFWERRRRAREKRQFVPQPLALGTSRYYTRADLIKFSVEQCISLKDI